MSDYIKELRKKIGHAPITIPHSVIIVINNQDEMLLEERSDDGFFDFPGGGIDPKETPEEAAIRELKEETGLIANRLETFKTYTGEITHYIYFNGDEIYGEDHVFICRDYSGELVPQPEEVTRLFFCALDGMPEKMSSRNKQIILDLKKQIINKFDKK